MNGEEKIDIEKVTADDLPEAHIMIGDIGSYKHTYDLSGMKVTLSEETRQAYKEAMNPDVSFWYRFKRFLLARNKAGKFARPIKDAILLLAPSWISKSFNTVDDFILNKIRYDMPTSNEKTTIFSRQILIFGAIFIVALIQLLGFDLGLELSPEANWVGVGSSVLGIILRLVTGRPVKLGKSLGIADTGD